MAAQRLAESPWNSFQLRNQMSGFEHLQSVEEDSRIFVIIAKDDNDKDSLDVVGMMMVTMRMMIPQAITEVGILTQMISLSYYTADTFWNSNRHFQAAFLPSS